METASAFVGGMSETWVLTEFTGPQAGVQVDLSPPGMYTLLGRALPTGAVPVLDELEDPVLAALPDRLAVTSTWESRFALVSELLAARILNERARRSDPEVAFAWSRLAARDGAVPVRELAAETGWSRRHLLTRFRGQIGLGPASAGRVLRFARASRLVMTTGAGLGEVAATCGYADQPHMVREFHALAGTTPSRFRAEWAAQFPSVQDAPPPPRQDR
ncbi:helix-turn-helix domain-containing protein [Pseudonocardia nantongensis]|uniref:helix-turn-helix domain-containing protein n=1 Tax=Pseudonocardia nantongensis TaxID=1181885 RepID=UPI00397E9154